MREMKPRGAHWLLLGIVLVYAAALLIAPLLAIVQGAFARGIMPVLDALTATDVLSALQVSFSLVIAATAINAIAGIAIAWVMVRHNFPGKRYVNALIDLPFVASPVIIGFVIIVLFGRTGALKDFPIRIAFAWLGMLLVTIFVTLPFVVREVMPVLASLTPEQEEAAMTLGASKFTTFRRVIFPAIWHGVLYGVVLTLARALGEFGGVAAAGGGVQGSTETATIFIYRSLSDRNRIAAYSVAVVLGLLAVGILVVMNRLRQQHEQIAPSEDV
jgi:sulfate transport system permease protein